MPPQPSAQARLTLQDAFERFAATVTPDDKREFTNTQIKDVRDEAIKIERQLRARRTQRNMARLEPFLRGVEHYSKVVEVLCNGTPYLSWIWAPVKLMLMITVDSLGAFEKLIEAYGKIADMLPRFDRLGTALSHDLNFQGLLALVYKDILEFHRRAYKFVRRRSWAIFFGSMWAGFESRFGTILRQLAYHSELIDKEAIAVDVSDAVAHSKQDTDKWEQQEREWQALKVRTVLSWLKTDDVLPEDLLEKHARDCFPRSCDWFIQHRKIDLWLKDGVENRLFWLYGKPGAGKSVICSSLIQHAQSNDMNVFYYFCTYMSDSTESASRLLRSLAAQIIQRHHDLAIYVHDVYFESQPTPSRKALLDLLPKLLQGLGSVRFVIDGVDEWDAREQKEILKDLMQLLSTDPSSCVCKILLASRDTMEISRSLRRKGKAIASISLSDGNEGHAIDRSIREFIDDKLSDLPDHVTELDPDASVLEQVKRKLLDKSNGMFLWVRLVLDSLEVVYSPEELRSLVEDLPSDLEALYARILRRLCSARGVERYGGVPTILSWICFSRRPLHKLELLHGLAIRPNDGCPDGLSVPLPQILDHCKPFVEERPDSTIAFVHFSVKEFLLRTNASGTISQRQAQLNISYACTNLVFRGLDFFDPNTTPFEHLVSTIRGTYRLLPYALTFWVEHCSEYFASEGSLASEHVLMHQLAELQHKHTQLLPRSADGDLPNSQALACVPESQLIDRLKPMAHLPVHASMLEVLYARWLTSEQFFETGQDAEAYATQNDRTLLSKLAAKLETTVIYLLSHDEVEGIPKPTLQAFQESYASTAFACRFPSCSRSSAGFASQELRRQHEVTHFHRLYCKVASCQWDRIGFKTKGSLDAHNRKHHSAKAQVLIPPMVRRVPMDEPRGEQQALQDNRTPFIDLQDSSSNDQTLEQRADFAQVLSNAADDKAHPQLPIQYEEIAARLRDPAREKRYKTLISEEDIKLPRGPVLPVASDVRAQLQSLIKEKLVHVKKVEQALRIFLVSYEGRDAENVARTVIRARIQLLRELDPRNGDLNPDLTLSESDFKQSIRHILSFFQKVMSRIANNRQKQAQQGSGSAQLNAANLQAFEDQHRQNRLENPLLTPITPHTPSSLVSNDPHGAPRYFEGAPTLTHLELPKNKRRGREVIEID